MNISLYSYPPLFSSILFLIMGVFVIANNYQSRINQSFFFLSVTTFGWQFSWFLLFGFPKLLPVDLIIKIGYTWITLLPIAYFYFAMCFLNLNEESNVIRVACGVSLVFIILVWVSDFFVNGYSSNTWGYYPKAGFAHPLYLVFLFFLAVRGLFKAIIKLRDADNPFFKNQLKYVVVAFGFYFLAATDFAANYGTKIYPPGFIFISISLFIIAYAIIKHRLMDIEVIIRETAIFAGIFGFSIGLFILAIAAGEQVLQPYIGQSRWIIPVFSLLLVTFAIRPIEKLVYSVVGKYLFRKKFEYQKTLQDAAEGMSKIRDPKKLLSLITHIISAKLKLTGVSVLLYDSKQERYRMKASRGNAKDKFINLSPGNPLISWLSEKKKPLTLEEIGEYFELTRERVRQIKEKALRRLRHASRSKPLRSYLG